MLKHRQSPQSLTAITPAVKSSLCKSEQRNLLPSGTLVPA
jgi:hypothetical protein